MINFLHTFEPSAVLAQWGAVTIYWYGLILALAMLAGVAVAVYFGRFYKVKSEVIIDLTFWLIVGGLLGARLYYIGLEWHYYENNFWGVVKIWEGGLAIHGGLLGGLLATWWFAKRKKISFWLLAAIAAPAVALGQAIGRWGNYFNQELFGLPTGVAWSIPIAEIHRPAAYVYNSFFHPTFLYESVGSLGLFVFLCLAHYLARREEKRSDLNHQSIVLAYLIFYSVIRFCLEEFRLEATPLIGVLRWPQVVSAVIALASLAVLIYAAVKAKKKSKLEKMM